MGIRTERALLSFSRKLGVRGRCEGGACPVRCSWTAFHTCTPHFHTAGPATTCSVLVERPAALSQLLESFVQCMAFEPGAAMQLLHSK